MHEPRKAFEHIKINERNQFEKPLLDQLDELGLSERSIMSNLSKLRYLKTALMQDLLTGKKRVTTLLNDAAAPNAQA